MRENRLQAMDGLHSPVHLHDLKCNRAAPPSSLCVVNIAIGVGMSQCSAHDVLLS